MKKERVYILVSVIILAAAIAGVTLNRFHMLNDFVIVTKMETAAATELPEESDAPAGEDKININTASVEELTALDGIGEALSERIVEYRTTNGTFEIIEDIMRVQGIGEKKFENISGQITTGE